MSEAIEVSTTMNKGEALRLCAKTTNIDVIIALTKHNNPYVRKTALREICPCRVKEDVQEFWTRVLEMIDDPDAVVRQQVLHTLCDGSPTHMEYEIAEALEHFNRDPDSKIRRQAHKCLTSYHRTGKWNIL